MYQFNDDTNINDTTTYPINARDLLIKQALVAMSAQRQTAASIPMLNDMITRTLSRPNGLFHSIVLYEPKDGSHVQIADGLHRILLLCIIAHIALRSLSSHARHENLNLVNSIKEMLYVDGDITLGFKHSGGMLNLAQLNMVFGVDANTGLPNKLKPTLVKGESSLVRVAIDIEANLEDASDNTILMLLSNITTARFTVYQTDSQRTAIVLFRQLNHYSTPTNPIDDLRALIAWAFIEMGVSDTVSHRLDNLIASDFNGNWRHAQDAFVGVMGVLRTDNSTKMIKASTLTSEYEKVVAEKGASATFKEFYQLVDDLIRSGLVHGMEPSTGNEALDTALRMLDTATDTQVKDLKGVVVLGMRQLRLGEWSEETVTKMVGMLHAYALVQATQYKKATDLGPVCGRAIKELRTVQDSDVMDVLKEVLMKNLPSRVDVQGYIERADIRDGDNNVVPWVSGVLNVKVTTNDIRPLNNVNSSHTIGAVETNPAISGSPIKVNVMDHRSKLIADRFVEELPFILP